MRKMSHQPKKTFLNDVFRLIHGESEAAQVRHQSRPNFVIELGNLIPSL
jgi:hypothetical protein